MPFLARTALLVAYSIITLWYVSIFARRRGTIAPFAPFLLWGILFDALAAFVFYDMLFTFWWSMLDFTFFICYAVLLVTLVRTTQKLP